MDHLFLLFILVGIVIGLIGGGGGIFAVPILVYAFHIDPILATFYSMVIVGVISLIGTIRARKQIAWRTGIIFSIPSIIVTLLMRRYIVPALPDPLFGLEKGVLLIAIFALVMFASSLAMLRKKPKPGVATTPTRQKSLRTIIQGVLVGLITGLVGAGGGFLIVPALIFFTGLAPKVAIVTSMFVISMNTLIGALGKIPHEMDGVFLLQTIGLAIIGLFIGMHYQKRLSGEMLSRGFALFMMTASIAMLTKELFF